MSTKPKASELFSSGMIVVPKCWYEDVKDVLESHSLDEECEMCLKLSEQARQFEQFPWIGDHHVDRPDDEHPVVDTGTDPAP